MSINQMTESSRGRSFAGQALIGCGSICLLIALLFGLYGLMKFASAQRHARTITLMAGDFKQTLHDPIKTSLSSIKFPVSHGQVITVDTHNPNQAWLSSPVMLGVRDSTQQENLIINLEKPRLVRDGPVDQWHLSRDEVEKINQSLTNGETDSQNAARSHVAFTITAVMLILGAGLILAGKRPGR
jgi:hypothetical protein